MASNETVQRSPDAADLLDNGRHIAAEEWAKSEAQFENVIRGVLEPIMASGAAHGLSSAEVAHLLTMAIPGFKERAASACRLQVDGAVMRRFQRQVGILRRPVRSSPHEND